MRTSAAEHLVRQHIRVLGRTLPAARDGNVASLHEARVATRRLRAALPLLGPGKKPSGWDELCGGSLGF
jgi:CHAD domain-containing protein